MFKWVQTALSSAAVTTFIRKQSPQHGAQFWMRGCLFSTGLPAWWPGARCALSQQTETQKTDSKTAFTNSQQRSNAYTRLHANRMTFTRSSLKISLPKVPLWGYLFSSIVLSLGCFVYLFHPVKWSLIKATECYRREKKGDHSTQAVAHGPCAQ